MDRLFIEQKVLQILSLYENHFGEDVCKSQSSSFLLSDISSVAWLKVLIDLENAFQIEMDLQEAGGYELPTLSQLTRYIQAKVMQKGLPAFSDAIDRDINLYPGIVFKPVLHCVDNQGKLNILTDKERFLLIYLWVRKGEFVKANELRLAIWDQYTGLDTVRQYIYRLRKKLYISEAPTSIILHVRGIGYALVEQFDDTLLQLAGIDKVNP